MTPRPVRETRLPSAAGPAPPPSPLARELAAARRAIRAARTRALREAFQMAALSPAAPAYAIKRAVVREHLAAMDDAIAAIARLAWEAGRAGVPLPAGPAPGETPVPVAPAAADSLPSDARPAWQRARRPR